MRTSLSPAASSTTPAGLPPSGRSENAAYRCTTSSMPASSQALEDRQRAAGVAASWTRRETGRNPSTARDGGVSRRGRRMSGTAIHLLVGTTKGAFVLDGDADRSHWAVRGPYCDGWPINHAIGDPLTGTMWAGGGGDWSGAGVWRSDDDGRTWALTKLTSGQMDAWAADDPGFAESIGWTEAPAPFGETFSQVWSLGRVGARLYAGTKPATLLVSDD